MRATFHLHVEVGGTILEGRFRLGNDQVVICHEQPFGAREPLDYPERRELLRKALLERIKREALR